MNRAVITHLAVTGALLALAVLRLQSEELRRPFDVDELLTVKYYTWAGIQPSGEYQPLPHIADYYALPAPTAGQLVMGAYCSLGRWPEPNNHVFNSLLINPSIAFGARNEWWARLPALLGAVVFVGGLYWFCAAVLGWKGAPLVVVWAWFHPYVFQFSQTARGYSWMLAFQVLLLLLAYRLARNPRSLALAALTALTAIISLMNVVSMSVDWVLPFYVALFWIRPGNSARPESLEQDRIVDWRKAIFVQGMVVAGAGFLYYLSHFPSLYSAAQKYGLAFHSVGGFFEVGYSIFDELFPSLPDKTFALFGSAGLIALCIARQDRFLATLVALLLACNLLHFLLTRKFPYARTAGHFIPFVVLGAAFVVDWMLRKEKAAVRRAVLFGLMVLLSLGLIVPSFGKTLEIKNLTTRLELTRQVKPTPGARVYLPLRSTIDYLTMTYCPQEWELVEVVPPGIDLDLFLFEQESLGSPLLDLSMTRLVHLRGYTQPFVEGGELPPDACILWYPEIARLGIDAKNQEAFVRQPGYQVQSQPARYQIKFAVYAHVQCYHFVGKNAGEIRKAGEVVGEALRRFGGRAVVFLPRQVEVLR